MRLETLSDNILLLEQHMNSSRNILRESCYGLNKEQQRIVEGIYNEFLPLIEASLTADQIKQLFGEIEKQSIAGGQSRTLAGKGVDVAKKANEVINNVGKWLQNTTPVKMADEKFEKLKNDINKKFPDSKLLDGISNLGIWMKENPGKSAAVIGVLTALASLAGGPVGGAIAGQVLRGAAELIKGEKLSTAVGKGIKTAALGYLSGKAFEMLGNWMAGFREQSIPFGSSDAGLENISWDATKTLRAPGMEWTQTTQGFNALVKPEEASAIRAAMNLIKGGGDGAVEGFDQLKMVADIVRSKDYMADMQSMVDGAWKAAKDNDSILQFINTAKQGLQAGAQGAVAAAGEKGNKKESYYTQARPLSEGQVYMLFNRVLTEAGFLDKVKAGAGKVAGAVAKGAEWAGKQATEKVTSAKLLAAWKLEGSPTDSEQLRKFLQDYGGIDAAIVDKVYTDMKLPVGQQEPQLDPAKAETIYAATKKTVANLNKKDRQRLIAYLNKQLGTA
jgi:hypothetical protein